ncbi:uncharacterized protein VTP21DRAFT_6298 [Calcarisporiella thermophila]|uniref:uncharacterized protein n=1 Tax=Calcarisporiella thermophila TaxID=911321 RepID=UPI003741F185
MMDNEEYSSISWDTGAIADAAHKPIASDEAGPLSSLNEAAFNLNLNGGDDSMFASIHTDTEILSHHAHSTHENFSAQPSSGIGVEKEPRANLGEASTSSATIQSSAAVGATSNNANKRRPPVRPMIIAVTDPRKEQDGTKDTYVSYQITTKTTLEWFSQGTTTVRRRFQDFVTLYSLLSREFPAIVIPPLPEKHRMEYLTGDRFSSEFLERRRASLQRFLERISRHPVLQRTDHLRLFLEASDFSAEATSKHKRESVLENLGDALLNAFTRIRKPDERFVAMREVIDKLVENIQAVERVHQRIFRRQSDMEQDYLDFSNSTLQLSQLEGDITEPLTNFSNALQQHANSLKNMTKVGDSNYLSQLHDYLAYCYAIKNVLKLRDEKQLDFEQLTEYLHTSIQERDRLLQTGRSSGGLSTYIRDKMDEFKGVDQDKAREERLTRLNQRIAELQEAVESSNDVSVAFSNEVTKEYELFMETKLHEVQGMLVAYAESRVEFYKESKKIWEEVVHLLEA